LRRPESRCSQCCAVYTQYLFLTWLPDLVVVGCLLGSSIILVAPWVDNVAILVALITLSLAGMSTAVSFNCKRFEPSTSRAWNSGDILGCPCRKPNSAGK
jgi:hypothetical protein